MIPIQKLGQDEINIMSTELDDNCYTLFQECIKTQHKFLTYMLNGERVNKLVKYINNMPINQNFHVQGEKI